MFHPSNYHYVRPLTASDTFADFIMDAYDGCALVETRAVGATVTRVTCTPLGILRIGEYDTEPLPVRRFLVNERTGAASEKLRGSYYPVQYA